MESVPLVRASSFLPFVEFLRSIGAPVEKRLDQVLLPQRAFEDPEALVPLNQALLFLDRNAAAEAVHDLGFQTARTVHVPQLGAFGRLISGSQTLFEALSTASRLIPLYNSALRIWLEPWGTTWRVCHHMEGSVGRGREFADQFTTGMLIDCIRLAAGPRWLPTEIHLEGVAWSRAAKATPTFGSAKLSRGDVCAIVLEPALLTYPLTYAKTGSGNSTDNSEDAIVTNAPADSFLHSLRQVVQIFLRDQKFDVRQVAEVAGLSARTLQRRLAEQGTDFSSLVDSARFESSLALLRDENNKLTDIAYELGYNEIASFTRAFRRWSGFAPSQYRRLQSQVDE